jgi:hypothetical protein
VPDLCGLAPLGGTGLSWLCASAVTVPVVVLSLVAYSNRRRSAAALEALAALKCPACGRGFGNGGARVAQAAAFERTRAQLVEAERRGLRLRLNGHWSFACPCGQALDFDPPARTLKMIDAAVR